MFKRTFLLPALITMALLSTSVSAISAEADSTQDDISARQALMDASAAAAGLSAAMLKKEMPYNPAAAKSAITTLWAASHTLAPFFDDAPLKGEDTSASPNIWKNNASFQKELQGYIDDTNAAKKIAGKEGPVDLATFKTAIVPVLNHCKACHQDYKLRD